jgi:hypothetical protein
MEETNNTTNYGCKIPDEYNLTFTPQQKERYCESYNKRIAERKSLDTADITRLSAECKTKYTEILDILDDNQKEILQKLNTIETIENIEERAKFISGIIDEFVFTLNESNLPGLLKTIDGLQNFIGIKPELNPNDRDLVTLILKKFEISFGGKKKTRKNKHMKFTKKIKNKKYKLTNKRYNKKKIGGTDNKIEDNADDNFVNYVRKSWNEMPETKKKALKIGISIAVVGIGVAVGVATAGLIPIGVALVIGVASIFSIQYTASLSEYAMDPEGVNNKLIHNALSNEVTREEKNLKKPKQQEQPKQPKKWNIW